MAEFASPIDTGNVLRARTEGTGRVVRDKSAEIMAGAIEQTIGAAVDISEAAAVAPLEAGLEEGLQEFAEAKQDTDLYDKLVGAAEEAGTAAEGGDEAAINEATATFTKLKRQVKLGNMTPAQAKLLAEDKLRQAVNENPFHREALIEAHGTTLGLHRNQLAALEDVGSAQKAQDAALYKMYATMAAKSGIPVLGKTLEELENVVVPVQLNKRAWENLQQKEKISSNEALNLFYGDSGNALKGSYNAYVGELNEAAAQHKASPESTIEEFNATIQAIEQSYTSRLDFNFGRHVERAHLNAALTNFTSAREIVQDSVLNDKSATWTANKLKITQDNLKSDALQDSSIRAGYVAKELLPDWIETNVLFKDNAVLAKGMIDYMTRLSSGRMFNEVPATTPEGKKITQEIGNILKTEVLSDKQVSEQQQQELYDTVGNMADLVTREKFSSEDMQNVLNLGAEEKIVNLTNNPEFSVTADKLRVSTERILSKVVIPNTVANLNDQVEHQILPRSITGQPVTTLRDAVFMDISPAGIVTFKTKDLPELSRMEKNALDRKINRLNTNHAVNFNKGIRTLAHVNGSKDYLAAARAYLGRVSLDTLPEITGALIIQEPEPIAEPIVAPEPTGLDALSDAELRKMANGGNRDASIILFERQEGFIERVEE